MFIILVTMLRGILRDVHTIVWNMVFPAAMLAGLGLYFNQPGYAEQLLGGVLTTNILFGSAIVTAFYVMSHRNRGVYKLLRAAPFSTLSFITAMTGARTLLALIVSSCVCALAVLLLGVRLSMTSLLLMLPVLLLGSVCFTAIGFIAANLSRDEGNVNMISNLIAFPMLFTSEAFYSLEHAPRWVQILGQLHPFHYLTEAMRIAINPEAGISPIWIPLGILALFTAGCLVLAAVTFRWDSERPAGRSKQHLQDVSAS